MEYAGVVEILIDLCVLKGVEVRPCLSDSMLSIEHRIFNKEIQQGTIEKHSSNFDYILQNHNILPLIS